MSSSKLGSLVFPIADALQTEMDFDADGKNLSGRMSITSPLGPWKVTFAGEVHSQELAQDQVSVVAHLRKDLYLLLVCTQGGHTLRGILFDGAKAKVKKGRVQGATDVVYRTIKEASVAYLKYENANNKWRTINAFDLD